MKISYSAIRWTQEGQDIMQTRYGDLHSKRCGRRCPGFAATRSVDVQSTRKACTGLEQAGYSDIAIAP